MNIAKYIMLMRCTRFPSKTIGIEPFATGREVANKLISTRLPGLPIVNKKNMEVKGIVKEFDVLGALIEGLDPDNFTAEKIMSGDPITGNLDTPAEELMEMMLEKNITMVPITKNNKLAGIVDICSLIELLMSPGSERYLR
jgi:CBS domain-containing protein